MARVIRATYPLQFSIGLLFLIFILSVFLSYEIFNVSWRTVIQGGGPLVGMLLSGVAVVIMALILWEEFLFPVRLKPEGDEILFRNHFTKLKTQVLIYCIIPVIIIFIYLSYEVSFVPFIVWAGICAISPVAGKLISGVKNYNDFLKLTNDRIEFRNNENSGVYPVRDLREIIFLRDEAGILHKIKLITTTSQEATIDLDEMELEPYLQTIEQFVAAHYPGLVNQNPVSGQ